MQNPQRQIEALAPEIFGQTTPSTQPNAFRDETAYADSMKAVYEAETLRLRNETIKQDMAERKIYANRIFSLVTYWLIFIGLILIATGGNRYTFKMPNNIIFSFGGLKLSDTVILALIGSTTLNVLALFYIVANYLFPKPKEQV